jgi:hypothetical protein
MIRNWWYPIPVKNIIENQMEGIEAGSTSGIDGTVPIPESNLIDIPGIIP